MAWRDSLREASFKGVSFYVESTDGNFGRRSVVHEFPQKAEAYVEDLGRKPRDFSIDGFVIGEDYFDARDAILAACEEEGPGELVHPFLGRYTVVCTGITLRETTQDGGMARISLKFIETSDPTAPRFQIDELSSLTSSKTSVIDDAKAAFETGWNVVGFATRVADQAVEVTEAVLGTIETAQKTIKGRLNEIADIGYKIRTIRANIRTIIASPEELAKQIDDVMTSLVAAIVGSEGGHEQTVEVLKKFFEGSTVIAVQTSAEPTTATDTRIKDNAVAIDNFFRQVTVANMTESMANKDHDSAQAAALDREFAFEIIDELQETASDDVYRSLQDLRVSVSRAVPPPGRTLAQEIELPVDQTKPSLVIAYDVFESLTAESDLITRNDVRHPGFIEAGSVLKALNG